MPDAIIQGFKLEETKDQQKTLEIVSPTAEIYKKEQVAKALEPQTKFYQSDQKIIEIKSTEALANLESRDLFFKGRAEIKDPDGFIIHGTNLEYSYNQQKIGTSESVQFESTPTFREALIEGWGTGFQADLKNKEFWFQKDVHFTFVPRQADTSPARIRGDSAKIFSDKGLARVEGNVAFQNKNISLRSDLVSITFQTSRRSKAAQVEQAIFQSLPKSNVVSVFDTYKLSSNEVVLGLKNRKEISEIVATGDVILTNGSGLEMSTERLAISNPQEATRKMKLSGNVYIKQGQDEAKCQEAAFDPTTDELLLKGDASFQRGLDVLAGEEIRYSKKKGILQISRASGQLQKTKLFPKNK